jgi:signal-transduction protein with cAMP-binding, CBS, and nucleotidyltransferase domain
METVGDIINEKGRAVHSIAPHETVLRAVETMCELRVGALLVCIDGAPRGIISERDIMVRVILARREPAHTKVEEVMTRDVACVQPDAKAREGMAIMTERRCRHLPVVADGRVVGLLSIGDLVRWASREHEFEIRMLTDYVRGVYPG